jgi:hypothetical protein
VTVLFGGLTAGRPHGWREFAGNLRKHTSVPSPNRMGLATIVAWDPATRPAVRTATTDSEIRTAWETRAADTLARRRWLWFALAAAGTLAIASAVRGQPIWVAATLGLLLAPLATPLACYYYVFVAAIPLLAARRAEVSGIILALVVAAGIVARQARLDTAEQYAAQSLIVLLAFGFVASGFLERARNSW